MTVVEDRQGELALTPDEGGYIYIHIHNREGKAIGHRCK